MERHGSESYFVIGEGLLGETVGGRDRTLAPADEALVPPFRFSRMGPSGAGRQLPEPSRRRLSEAIAVGGGGESQIPAGFTYLGQFVDHDLTFDKTSVMLGEDVSPAELLQARSPSLDLDSLYGAGPARSGIGEVLRGGRHPPEDGEDPRGGGPPRDGRVRSPPRCRHHREGEAEGDHPGPEER